MTKCRICIVGLAMAILAASGSACAGPDRASGPDGGTPALSGSAPRRLDVKGRDDRQAGELSLVTPYLSGYAIHNRIAIDSTVIER